MTKPTDLTAILVCPDRGLAQQFSTMIAELKALNLVGDLKEYPSSAALEQRLKQVRPDAVLLDVGSAREAALQLLSQVVSAHPEVSVIGLHGNTGQANYAAAKGGIAMFAIAVALEMERFGVRSNCVAPTGNTRLIATMPGRGDTVLEPEEYTEFNASNPGNVAPAIVWLASDLSRNVTGQVFGAGGLTITHYSPWTRHVVVTVPGADRKWKPEEINAAMNTLAFGTRHPGLRGGAEFQGGPAPRRG